MSSAAVPLPLPTPRSAASSSLASAGTGHCYRIREVQEPGTVGERLMEMGLTPGTTVRIVRRGLTGDPLQVQVRGYMLTLRRAQAARIIIDPSS